MRNPILRLELLRRFRGFRAALGLFLALLIPAIAVAVSYASATSTDDSSQMFFGEVNVGAPVPVDQNGNPLDVVFDGDGKPITMPVGPVLMGEGAFAEATDDLSFRGPPLWNISSVGRKVFGYVGGALLFIVIALVPVLVGGSIAGERANLTLAPLQISRLTARQIVIGKLGSSLAYLLLLLVCAVPLLTVPYLLGGIDLAAILASVGVTLLIAVELAAVALAASAWLRRPTTAIISAILMTGAVLVGPFLLMALGFMVQARSGNVVGEISAYRLLSSASPVSLFTWVTDDLDLTIKGIGPIRILSLIWWAFVTFGALELARWKVRAPVAVDR